MRFILLLLPVILAGCASVMNDSTQPMRIETKDSSGQLVNGADCNISNDFGTTSVKSGQVSMVRRSSKDLDLVCRYAGNPDASARAVSRANSGMWGNIIIGGGIGAMIDHSKGTAYTYPTWIQMIFGQSMIFDRSIEQEGRPTPGTAIGAYGPTSPQKTISGEASMPSVTVQALTPASGNSRSTPPVIEAAAARNDTVTPTAPQSLPEHAVYPTGDAISRDGRVVRVRIGNAILSTLSGELWTVPPQPGASGEARIRLNDADFRTDGTMQWRVVSGEQGGVRVEADLSYMVPALGSTDRVTVQGRWAGTYLRGALLPDSFTAGMSSGGPPMVHPPSQPAAQGAMNAQPRQRTTNRTGDKVGQLTMTDTTFGRTTSGAVTISLAAADETVYSTGDTISVSGRILKSRIGDAVVIVESGELWSVPLRPGTSGEARIRRTDVDFPSDGTMKWSVTTVEPGKLRVDAEVSYGYPMTSASHRGKALGKWVATYGANDVLPESFTANINGPPGADSRGYNTNTVTGRMTFDVQ